MKFPIVKQVDYELKGVPHKRTLWECIKWWILRKNRYCKSFCLTCEFWFSCQELVAWYDSQNQKLKERRETIVRY